MRSHSRIVLAFGAVVVAATLVMAPTMTWAAADARRQSGDAFAARTWLLTSPSEIQMARPPDDADTRAEVAEVQALANSRDAAALDRIRYWDAGAPAYRWTQRTIDYAISHGVGGHRAFRLLALLHVAISDATLAAFESKSMYGRERPATSLAAIPTPATPGYPDEHAVAAGAAETVLAYVFPADAAQFSGWAAEAARSRVEGGVAYPSDVAAGLELGRQVGDKAVAWGKADGSDAPWTGSVPTEPGRWTGTNPIEPTAGSWKPWALASGDQFRPGPPPAPDSEQLTRELAEVKAYRRTNLTNLTAALWEYYGGRASFDYWNELASRLMFEHRLDEDPRAASHVYALMNVASLDAGIACWDAKYTYWMARPTMLDPTITTVFPTPNHPSYPSAHSCISTAQGAVLARFFPSETASLNALVDEIAESRVMAGIHYRVDLVEGETLGVRVAEAVWARGTRPPDQAPSR
jgi:membrane-associated phospholipid phosphatase